LNELLKLEVPELKDGQIEIVNSARIAGVRAKVAVLSHNPQIDPIGSIVGVKGVRIKAVSSVLFDENIDCIDYSDEMKIFISRALSPAIVKSVSVLEDEKKAIATVAYDQKRKAIGSNGFNIRLASMLTGYHIDLIEEEEGQHSESMEDMDNAPSSLDDLFN
jgi:N utilization substance protein A